jgi:hypothetical protein
MFSSFLNFSVLSFLVLSSDPARRWTEQVLPSFFQYTGTRDCSWAFKLFVFSIGSPWVKTGAYYLHHGEGCALPQEQY